MLIVIPRSRSSGALSMFANSVNELFAGSASANTFVIAAVNVVFP